MSKVPSLLQYAASSKDPSIREFSKHQAHYFHLYGLMQKTDHAFSRNLAEEFGIPAALVVKYLSFRISKSKKVNGHGQQSHCESIESIAQHYPYLSVTAIHEAIRRIPTTLLPRREEFNRKTKARSTSYSIARPLAERAGRDLVHFSPTVATQHGIPAAIVLHRLEHEIRLKLKSDITQRFHPVSPTALGEKVGLSRSTVNRAINTLLAAQLIERDETSTARHPKYAVVVPAAKPESTQASAQIR